MPQKATMNTASIDAAMDQITRLCADGSQILQKQIHELRKMPKPRISGHLIKTSCDGYPRWRRVMNANESSTGKREVAYLGKTEQKTILQLAERLYYESSLCVKEKQLEAMQAFLKKAKQVPARSLSIVNDPDIRKLIGNKSWSDKCFAWQNEDYSRNPKHPETLTIPAADGRMVRSKSEAIIISELLKANLPFRYECGIQLRNFVAYPDFMILHPITGKIYLWEHLGLMDDQAYGANAADKIKAYIEIGYIPMQNLILTSETRNHPLDYRLVQMLIEYFFTLTS